MININRLNQNNEYSLGNPNIQVKRSTLKMRETIQSTGYVGRLIPLTVHETLPSERTRIRQSINMEFSPFTTNILHEITGEMSYWFVPYRIIWDKWERFITGCDEDEDITDGSILELLPTVDVWKINKVINENILNLIDELGETGAKAELKAKLDKYGVDSTYTENYATGIVTALKNTSDLEHTTPDILSVVDKDKISEMFFKEFITHSIYDYYGLHMTSKFWDMVATAIATTQVPYIYYTPITGELSAATTTSEYYADNKTNIDRLYSTDYKMPISLNVRAYNKIYNDWVRQLDWEPRRDVEELSTAKSKYAWDLFTRARRYQLRGPMPTVPVQLNSTLANARIAKGNDFAYGFKNNAPDGASGAGYYAKVDGKTTIQRNSAPYVNLEVDPTQLKVEGELDVESAGGWNVIDMITPAGLLNYYMANAKIKPRYANQLLARWGIKIQDERYQYAQYITSTNISITQNGVTQTSPQIGDSTLQGNITGQAWGNGGSELDFFSPEHGVIISILQIKPSNAYEMGKAREYYKESRFDYPTPELVDTPDVQILNSELAPEQDGVLGYMGIYDEYRTKYNKVTGLLRPSIKGSLYAKTLARNFDEVSMQSLITIEEPMKRVKQFTTQPDFIFFKETNFLNTVPIPYINDPRIFI